MSCGAKKVNSSAMGNSYTPKKAAAKSVSKGSGKNAALTNWGAGFGAPSNFGQPKVTFSGRGKK